MSFSKKVNIDKKSIFVAEKGEESEELRALLLNEKMNVKEIAKLAREAGDYFAIMNKKDKKDEGV